MISFLPSGPDAQGHQDGAAQGAGAGPAGQHHAIEHQHLVVVGERPAMEGGDGGIERLGHLAHRRSAHRPAEQRQQRLADLAGRQPQHEAGEDHPVDLRRAPRIGVNDFGRAVAPRARHVELDVAELGEQMPSIGAVAAVGGIIGVESLEMAIDRRRHPAFDDLLQSLPGEGAVALAPLQAVGLHRLHELEGHR